MPEPFPPAVFADMPQEIRVAFRNAGKDGMDADLRFRLYQVSSATVMPVGEVQPFKKLQVLGGQTVIEAVPLKIPAVKTAARFQVQWFDGGKKVGASAVIAYPGDILKELKTLAGEKPPGILDPVGDLRKSLDGLKVECEDLEKEPGLAGFKGKLAVITAYASKDQLPPRLIEYLAAQAKAGTAIVWIQPPDMAQSLRLVTAYGLRLGAGAVVLAHPATVANLGQSAGAQAALIHFAQMAIKPTELPTSTTP